MKIILSIIAVFCFTLNVSAKELTKEELVIKYNLPPEPDKKLNNSTVLGVDSNNNKIRDDWERAIVFNFYDDEIEMTLHNEYARNSFLRIKSYNESDIEIYKILLKELSLIVGCASVLNKNTVLSSDVVNLEVDTYERYKSILSIENEMSTKLGGTSRNASLTKNDCVRFSKY